MLDDRAVGMGSVGGISFLSVARWLDENGVDDPSERQDFFWIIKHLDSDFRQSITKRNKSDD